MLHLSSLIVVSTMLVTQATETSPSWKHLQELDPLVGTWVFEGPLQGELVGLPKGTSVRMEFSFQWVLNKAVLRWEWKISAGGKQVAHGLEHLGWNAKEGKIVGVMFSTDGDFDTSHWTIEKNAFTSHFIGSLADGTSFKGDVILKVEDENTLTWKAVGYSVGEATPINTTEYRYRRQ